MNKVQNPFAAWIAAIIAPAALVVVLALSGGCVVAPVYVESGTEGGFDAAVAIVELGNKKGDVIVQFLDGKQLASPYTTWNGGYSAVRELRLSPGFHVVDGTVAANGIWRPFHLSATFESGNRYRIGARQVGYGLEPFVEQIGGQVSGKSL